MPDRQPISINSPPIWIAAILGAALLGGAVVYLAMRPTSPTAPAASSTPAAAPSSAGRSLRSLDFTDRQVAPLGNPATLEEGLVQRKDGALFIHAGMGSVTVFPSDKTGAQFLFGLRLNRDKSAPRPIAGLTLNDRAVQDRIKFTDAQRDLLKETGGLPQPTSAVQNEIRDLVRAYVDGADDTRPAAENALLAVVRRDGETRAPAVAKWYNDREAVLTDEQRTLLRSPSRPATSAPAVER